MMPRTREVLVMVFWISGLVSRCIVVPATLLNVHDKIILALHEQLLHVKQLRHDAHSLKSDSFST